MIIMPHKKPKGGYFIEHPFDMREKFRPDDENHIKNTLVQTGALWFLETVFQGAAVLPATFYLGLTNVDYNWDSTLADLHAGEPVGNGYARKALNQDNVDWTVQEVDGAMQAISKIVTFVASANWTQPWQRGFICDAAAGTAGNVLAVSGPAAAPRTVLSGAPPSFQYTYWLRG